MSQSAQTPRDSHRPRRRLTPGLNLPPATVALVALLPFATVHPPVVATVGALAAAAGLMAWTRAHHAPARLAQAALAVLAAVWLLSALPMLPVPAGAREALTPGYADLVAVGLAAAGVDHHPLALAPREALAGFVFFGELLLLAAGAAVSTASYRGARDQAAVLTAAAVALGVLAVAMGATGTRQALWFGPTGRWPAVGPFVNDNHAAIAAAVLLPQALVPLRSHDAPRRLLGGAGIAAGLAVLWLAGSRGGWLAAGAGVVTLALLLGGRHLRLATATGVAVSAVTTLAVGPRRLDRMFDEALRGPAWTRGHAFDDVFSGRTDIWHDAWALRDAAPWTGSGTGGFADAFETVKSSVRHSTVTHLHMDPLQAVVEHGVIVAALGAVGLVMVLAVALRAWRQLDATAPDAEARPGGAWIGPLGHRRVALAAQLASSAALGVGSLADFPFRIGFLAVVAALLVGALLGSASTQESPRRAAPLGVAVVVAAAAALWLATPHRASAFANADSWLDRGQAAWDDGRVDDAEAAWRAALHAHPLEESALIGLARVFARRGDALAAADALQNASRMAPSSPWPWLGLAHVYDHLGMVDARRDAWRRLLSINAQGLDPRDLLEQAFAAEDDPGAAVRGIVPRMANRQCEAANVLTRLDVPDEAERLFRIAIERHDACRPAFAKALLRWGRPAEAWAVLEPGAHGCLGTRTAGLSLTALGRHEEAVTFLERSLTTCGASDRLTLLGLADARLANGDPRGLLILERLLEADPTDRRALRAAAAATLALGRTAAATEHYAALVATGHATDAEQRTLERLRAGLPP